jgi:hypothetical protein
VPSNQSHRGGANVAVQRTNPPEIRLLQAGGRAFSRRIFLAGRLNLDAGQLSYR